MGSFAGFASFAPFDAGSSPAAAVGTSTSFNLSSGTTFVPKSKQVPGGQYPELGSTSSSQSDTKKKDENADPCHGKPKEFFIYSCDENSGVCTCTFEQLTFVSIHYPEHYTSPIDILMWLYDMAEYRDYPKVVKAPKTLKTETTK